MPRIEIFKPVVHKPFGSTGEQQTYVPDEPMNVCKKCAKKFVKGRIFYTAGIKIEGKSPGLKIGNKLASLQYTNGSYQCEKCKVVLTKADE